MSNRFATASTAMVDDENPAQRGQLYRIAWKFRKFGATGSGPWMQNRETVEAWLETLSRRYHEVEHWVESQPAGSSVDRDARVSER